MRQEIARIHRVSDMLCTAHAGLRDKLQRRALILDLTILGLSTWLTAMIFVAPRIGVRLSPRSIDSEIWLGLLAIGTFILAIFQTKLDWKGRAGAHGRSSAYYAGVKGESSRLLRSDTISSEKAEHLFERYSFSDQFCLYIPENEFLAQKKRHKIKVRISRVLDERPGASVVFLRIRIWFRDNWPCVR